MIYRLTIHNALISRHILWGLALMVVENNELSSANEAFDHLFRPARAAG